MGGGGGEGCVILYNYVIVRLEINHYCYYLINYYHDIMPCKDICICMLCTYMYMYM